MANIAVVFEYCRESLKTSWLVRLACASRVIVKGKERTSFCISRISSITEYRRGGGEGREVREETGEGCFKKVIYRENFVSLFSTISGRDVKLYTRLAMWM